MRVSVNLKNNTTPTTFLILMHNCLPACATDTSNIVFAILFFTNESIYETYGCKIMDSYLVRLDALILASIYFSEQARPRLRCSHMR